MEIEGSGANSPEKYLELEWQGVRARAVHPRSERKVIVRPGEALMIMPYARAPRLVTVTDVGAGAPHMRAFAPDLESQMILDSIREERAVALAGLVEYLEENGVVEGRPETFEEHHAMQKYTYLANAFGEPPHYAFDFLENGAYSSDLAIGLYAGEKSGVGAPPFRGNAEAGEAFVQMVQGRGRLTLQAMTFAMRDMRSGTGRSEFVDTMRRERSRYSRRLLEWAYDRVFEARGRLPARDE